VYNPAGWEERRRWEVTPAAGRVRHVLSLKQPWATLLVHGLKSIEIRRWSTTRRGPLLIHAGRIADARPDGWAHLPAELREQAELRGGIVGVGTLVDCIHYRDTATFQADEQLHLNTPDWFEPAGVYGFRFTNLRPLPFRACPGWFRIFPVEDDGGTGVPPVLGEPTGEMPVLSVAVSPGLLVSVRSMEEVESALSGGATLLDVKEPKNGPLGAPSEETARAVLEAVAGRVPVSVAMGEHLEFRRPSAALAGVSYFKWGPAGLRTVWALRAAHEMACDRVRAVSPEGRVVLVAYADWQKADAPAPEEVCDLACQTPGSVLLIDTFAKPSELLKALPLERVALLCRLCRSAGVRVALAGSLTRAQIETLLPTGPDWFAVRGAVCAGGRDGVVSVERVRELAVVVAED
jgi:(5-formylfuran-3-yl)methyl phosphate synthase